VGGFAGANEGLGRWALKLCKRNLLTAWSREVRIGPIRYKLLGHRTRMATWQNEGWGTRKKLGVNYDLQRRRISCENEGGVWEDQQ